MQQPFGTKLIAGDTWKWTVPACGYSAADGWTLKYFFRGPGKLDVTATTGDDGGFAIEVPAATTDVPAGTYAWQIIVSNASGERREIARGTVEILPNIEKQGEGYDGRSWVKRTLDALRAVLEGNATREEKYYQIAGRSIGFMSVSELTDQIERFEAKYRREQIEAGQLSPNHNMVHVRFGR